MTSFPPWDADPDKPLRGADLLEEAAHRLLELARLPGHALRRRHHHLDRGAGLHGLLPDIGDRLRHRLCAARRNRYIRGNLLGGGLLASRFVWLAMVVISTTTSPICWAEAASVRKIAAD
jgi:hypothetical protein